MENKLKNLSLIVLNYNSALDTIQCVQQLLSFNSGFKIIIIDNQSKDNSFILLKEKFSDFNNVNLILSPSNNGYSSGNNIGIKYAIEKYNSKYVGIINPDVIIPKEEVIQNMLNALDSNEHFGFVGARIESELSNKKQLSFWDIPNPLKMILGTLNHFKIVSQDHYVQITSDIAQVDCIPGCFFIAKTKSFQKIDFFDENTFLYNEENIIGIKCKHLGIKLIILTNQFYFHNHKSPKSDLPLIQKLGTTKYAYMSNKYFCKQYYSKYLVPFIILIEGFNKVLLLVAFAKNKIILKERN